MFVQKRLRTFAGVLLALVLAAAAYGFAAANTVGATKAGDGNGAVSGYTVSGVTYNLDTANPDLVASVDFSLNAQATSVYAAVGDNSATTVWTWSNACSDTSGGAGTSWHCVFGTPPSVQNIYFLRVVATGP